MASLPVVLITGANQGLGWHTAQQLAETGKFHVIIGSRDISKGETAKAQIAEKHPSAAANVSVVKLDVQSDDSIDAAVSAVKAKHGKLDILLNNAGAYKPPSRDINRRKVFSFLYDLNATSPSIVTESFLPLLKASTYEQRRIVFVSTGLASFTIGSDDSHPWKNVFDPIYRSAKAAMNSMALYFANILEADGIASVMVCPGYCATAFNNNNGTDPPEKGASGIVKAATQGSNKEMSRHWINLEGSIPW